MILMRILPGEYFNRYAIIFLLHKQSNHINSLVYRAQDSIRGIMPLLKELEESYDFLFIGGFSMGGCLALHLLREPLLPSNVKGIFSLSSKSFIIPTLADI